MRLYDTAVISLKKGIPDMQNENLPSYPLDPQGLEDALRYCDIQLRFNVRSKEIECKINDHSDAEHPISWQRLSAMHESTIKRIVNESVTSTQRDRESEDSQHKEWRIASSKWSEWINTIVYERQVDPFMEWLSSLPAWDGQTRSPLHACFALRAGQNDQCVRWAAWQPLYAAIVRAIEPGHIVDHMVVLDGAQGCGKTSYWSHMLPPSDRSTWWTDDIDLSSDSQKRIEKILGTVVAVVDDMVCTKHHEPQRVRQFLTQSHCRVRFAYQKHSETIPFRHVLVGCNLNEEYFLDDPTALRRFVIVGVQRSGDAKPDHIASWWDTNREQVWAEALHKVRENENVLVMPDAIREYMKQKEASLHSIVRERRSAAGKCVSLYAAKVIEEHHLTHGDEVPINMSDVMESEFIVPLSRMQGNVDIETLCQQSLLDQGYKRAESPRRFFGGTPRRYWIRVLGAEESSTDLDGGEHL